MATALTLSLLTLIIMGLIVRLFKFRHPSRFALIFFLVINNAIYAVQFFNHSSFQAHRSLWLLSAYGLSTLYPVSLYYLLIRYLNRKALTDFFFIGFSSAFSLVFAIMICFNPSFIIANNLSQHPTGNWLLIGYLTASLFWINNLWWHASKSGTAVAGNKRLPVSRYFLIMISLYPIGVVLPINQNYLWNNLFPVHGVLLIYYYLVLTVTPFHAFWLKSFTFFRKLTTMTILALPPTVLSLLIRPAAGHHFSIEFNVVMITVFFFLFFYFQSTFNVLENRLFPEVRHLKSLVSRFFLTAVKLRTPARLVSQLQSLLGDFLGSYPFAMVIKQIEKSRYLYCHHHLTTSLDSRFKSIFNWMIGYKQLLLYEDVSLLNSNYVTKSQLKYLFSYFHARAFIPLILGKQFLGLIVIPDTKPVLTVMELMFLNGVHPFMSLAMHNAYYYEQLRQLSHELWDINENLHDKILSKTKALEDAINDIYNLDEEQKHFFTMASHHLRTPLTSIKAATAVLWQNHFQDKFKTGLFNILSDNTRRLESLIYNMIIISKLDQFTVLDYHNINLPGLIKACHHITEKEYADKGLQWIFNLPDNLTFISGIKEHLELIFLHLFSNACKFSRSGGAIRVSMQVISGDDLQKYFNAESLNYQHLFYLEFSVSDHGEGIPEDEKKAIFNSFHQAKESRHRYQGNGLGLFVIKRLLELHHGLVALESKLGIGTTFSFILPLENQSAAVKQEKRYG